MRFEFFIEISGCPAFLETKTKTGAEPCVTKEAVTSVRLRPLCRQMRLAVDSNEGAWENVWPTKNRRWEGVVDFWKVKTLLGRLQG